MARPESSRGRRDAPVAENIPSTPHASPEQHQALSPDQEAQGEDEDNGSPALIYNETDLRSPPQQVSSNIKSAQSEKDRSQKSGLKHSTCLKLTIKVLEFFDFNLQMAKRDSLCQWRLENFFKKMPSCKELRQLSKEFKIPATEQILFKLLLEMQEKFLSANEPAPYKTQMKYLFPAAKHFYKQLAEGPSEAST